MPLEEDIKQKKFKSVFQKALLNLFYTSEFLSLKISTILKEFGITKSQYNVLRILAGSNPKALTPGEIKAVMISKQGDLTRLIDRMTLKNIVDRKICPTNRRNVNINITSEGLELLEEIAPHIIQVESKFLMNNLSESEAETLSNLLDQVRS